MLIAPSVFIYVYVEWYEARSINLALAFYELSMRNLYIPLSSVDCLNVWSLSIIRKYCIICI